LLAKSPFNTKDHAKSICECTVREFEAAFMNSTFGDIEAELPGVPLGHQHHI
jgi:hypothetical protein